MGDTARPRAGEVGSEVFPGGYRILREIGAGPRGAVFEASDGRRVQAIKLYRAGEAVDRAVLSRFVRGAPKRVRHASLPVIERLGETRDGRLFAVLPLLRGDSLSSILEDWRRGESARPSLSPLCVGPGGEAHPRFVQKAVELFAEAAEGLGSAHAAGLVHGQLQPANLILSPAGRFVVTDFGQASAHRGSDRYTAPECVGLDAATPASDVFALGSMLAELLSSADSPARGHAADPSARSPPRALLAVLRKATASDPTRRYPDATSFAEDLRRFQRHEPPRASLEEEEVDTAPVPTPASALASTPVPVPVPVLAPEGGAAAEEAVPATASPTPARARRSWPRRALASIAVLACLVAAVLGVQKLQRDRRSADHEAAALRLVEAGDYSGAIEESRRMASVDPANGTARALEEYARTSAVLRSVLEATNELGAARARSALAAVTEAERYRPSDGALESLAAKLRERIAADPVLEDIESDDPLLRLRGLRSLADEIERGKRPRSEARHAARCIRASDLEVRLAAYLALALARDGSLFAEAIPIAEDGPKVALEEEELRTILDAFDSIDDDASRAALCAWGLDAARSLDGAERPARVALAPNLTVELRSGGQGGFVERWIRTAARVDPRGLLEEASSLALERGVTPQLVAAVASTSEPETAEALFALASRHAASGGHLALAALREAGHDEGLIEILRSELPIDYRIAAVRELGAGFGAVHAPELLSVVARSPEPRLRRAAFELLAREGLEPARLAVSALGDPDLRSEALALLLRLEGTSGTEALWLGLLEHPDADARALAVRNLSVRSGLAPAFDVALRLLSDRRVAREAALEVLARRGDLASIPTSLGIALGAKETTVIRQLGFAQMEVSRIIGRLPDTVRRPIEEARGRISRLVSRAADLLSP